MDHFQIQTVLKRVEIRRKYRGEQVDIGIDTEVIDHLKLKHEIAMLKRDMRRERFNDDVHEGPPPPEPRDDLIRDLVSELPNVSGGWREFFLREFDKSYTADLLDTLRGSRGRLTPSLDRVLHAFSFIKSPRDVRVLLVGNRAYRWRGFNGMGFGTTEGCGAQHVANLRQELGGNYDATLEDWARQGVLCLAVGPTCSSGADDHTDAWSRLLQTVIARCLSSNKKLQAIAIGADARKLFNMSVTQLSGSLSQGQCLFSADYLYRSDFLMSRVFSHTNSQLRFHKLKEVRWLIND
ncbi:uracil-DNA glycosylase [Cyprinid herpesvirus 1]|uniref:Uracil-DNA glycosylase n=1 Tax=Cyprinid herpesvirus 1 TaxID=317858 RepID=K7PCL1_9VIRU|nr:uracil-DNA glycosylase [Cyprinid herpesvirus 1]AFJ20395.1 uracil-DNA glycosylase [Cyprinid herpesvirus 1]